MQHILGSRMRIVSVPGMSAVVLAVLTLACKAPEVQTDAAPTPPGFEPDARAGDGGMADASRRDAPEDAACTRDSDCNDGVACTADRCDLEAFACVYTPNDDVCQTGGFCNGVEVCDRVSDCQAGTPPTMAPGVECRSGQIVAGQSHTCFLLTDGAIKCWGEGESGQLGNGSPDNVGDDEPPAFSPGLDFDGNVMVQIATGGGHTCALEASGRVRCWGRNDQGQLGYAHTNDIDDVTQSGYVNLNGTATQISAGDAHTCARLSSGIIKCWGRGTEGQLGNGGFANVGDNETPVVAGTVNLGRENNRDLLASQVVAGGSHTCAALEDGRVMCWGSGALGQTAQGTPDAEPLPKLALIGTDINAPQSAVDVIQLAAGQDHTCALLNVGAAVRCWGRGSEGQLGYGNTNDIGDNESPFEAGDVFVGGGEVVEIAAGGAHTCARSRTGRVRCWGRGAEGQLGYGNTSNIGDNEAPSTVAEDIALGESAVQLTAGGAHTCALLDTGAARCWGQGAEGQLGYGNTDNIGDDEAPATAGNVLATPGDIAGTSR